MREEQLIEIIQHELIDKTWGITEQILKIHSPDYIDDKIQFANVVEFENEITVYLPIKDEKFYLIFYIDSIKNEIIGISTEAYISIYFKATSENLTINELKNCTSIEISKGWNKGDHRKFGIGNYNFSCIIIKPNVKPSTFQIKLSEIINLLNQDKKGIKKLSEIANGYIQVVMEFHDGNGMIGGPNLSSLNLKLLHELGLSIDFDLYTAGNRFKD
ncbi:DUF4279 domain-containing protein [Frigoriflavimonas asaccharolytica]|uniref:DUF4279 domain-containing protein n=1 Tax=Frigoriflavimonas asaccharolytica TaxID=2735899 RepID=A0A8J8G8D9_9FLAO|nr:DUF4279 domain-containing protein [Frigoriflavimonas asaccharolytica]NRS91827.1 hypothetical protein [Frigoriflavimonas asaccharolytica]